MPANNSGVPEAAEAGLLLARTALLLEGTRVTFVVAGRGGEGRTFGFARKTRDVMTEVTMSERERPGRERSRMYQRAGLTSARVRVSCRVDCQGRRRCGNNKLVIVLLFEEARRDGAGGEGDVQLRTQSRQKRIRCAQCR